MDQCESERCNMPKNHDGPHGVHIGSGLILAPYGGSEGGFDWEESDAEVPCESCGMKMRKKRFKNGGGILDCLACRQNWSFQPDGSSSSALTTLWPSGMKEADAVYREYVDWRLKQWVFSANARCEIGLIDEAERARQIASATKTVEDWKRDHPPKSRLWIKRLLCVI